MKNSRDKGLLVVSFGTTHNDTCKETIGAIEEHLAKAMPDRGFYRAWTSSFIIRKLKERDGVQIDTVGEALERMSSEGIADVLIVPTHLLPGAEYDKVLAAVEKSCEEGCVIDRERVDAVDVSTGAEDNGIDCPFEKITVSRPLLDTDEDLKRLSEVIAEELLGSGSEALSVEDSDPGSEALSVEDSDPGSEASSVGLVPKALVLMGHGSADKPEVNRVYVSLEEEFKRAGYYDVLVGTVEGSPSIDDVIEKLRDWRNSIREHLSEQEDGAHSQPGEEQTDAGQTDAGQTDAPTVMLAPLMIVAGDHAINDMAGEDPDSWKNRIEAALGSEDSGAAVATKVIPIIRGLGSYAGIQEMFLEKTGNAVTIHQLRK